MALTEPPPRIAVLGQGPADRYAAVIHPPLRPSDLRLGPFLLDLPFPRQLIVLPLQVRRVPLGLVGCPRLK